MQHFVILILYKSAFDARLDSDKTEKRMICEQKHYIRAYCGSAHFFWFPEQEQQKQQLISQTLDPTFIEWRRYRKWDFEMSRLLNVYQFCVLMYVEFNDNNQVWSLQSISYYSHVHHPRFHHIWKEMQRGKLFITVIFHMKNE